MPLVDPTSLKWLESRLKLLSGLDAAFSDTGGLIGFSLDSVGVLSLADCTELVSSSRNSYSSTMNFLGIPELMPLMELSDDSTEVW